MKKKIKILQIVGGSYHNGAFQGANILHKSLIEEGINSVLLNDTVLPKERNKILKNKKNIVFIQDNILRKILSKIFVLIEKFLKSLFLHTPRETFTIGLFGFDITKLNEFREADIIHIHWLGQGFINIKSLSKINKPVVWTMRDMWAFTGGSHYTMDFQKYEKSYLSKLIKLYKKKNYNLNFKFVAPSNWLLSKAKNSLILNKFNIHKINNNIDINNFKFIGKDKAKKKLNIKSNKKIILYGAQNPQSKRKGWKIFLQTIKKLDKKKYFLLIFGNFWSQNDLEKIGIEYKSLGFVHNINKLNAVYSCADLFVASSIQDAWPKTFAEAMCCNIPIICFDKTSISEIVEHKKTGYIVNNFSSAELKKSIEWVSQNLNSNLLNNRRNKNLMNSFNSKFIAKKYIKLYESLLAN